MNEDQFLLRLDRFITERKGGVSLYAKELGVSPAMVSYMKNGKRRPSEKVLHDMGYERKEEKKINYVKVK